jgi:eukaryotic-like serine/threonine-protein kinase
MYRVMDEAPRAPARLGRYKVLTRLASGGMGTVWIAQVEGALGFERLVAIKTIRSDYAQEDPFRTMFIDEVRIASRIEHPNVARVLDVGENEGRPYVVFEWVHGESVSALARAVRKKGDVVSASVVLRIVVDACKGLHAAHELRDEAGAPLNVVHRDVSPQNVLVGVNGSVKVIDFGIAKARDRLSSETTVSSLKGKVSYMSPEQALALPLDRRADVFGLGAFAYELLAGRSPYAASNETATLHRLATGDPPPMPLPDGVPSDIAALVLRAIEREPERRFASALELSTAIEDADAAARASGRSSLVATSEELAEYVAFHLADSLEARRDLIEKAKKHDAGADADSPLIPIVEAAVTQSGLTVSRAHEQGRVWAIIAAACASTLLAAAVAWHEGWPSAIWDSPRTSQAAALRPAQSLPTVAPLPTESSSPPTSAPTPATSTAEAATKPSSVASATKPLPSSPLPARRAIVHSRTVSSPPPPPAQRHPDYGGF